MLNVDSDLQYGHYPYGFRTPEAVADRLMQLQFERVAKLPVFHSSPPSEVVDHLLGNYQSAKSFFTPDLTSTYPYHFVDHAVYQAGYDTAEGFVALFKHNPQEAAKLQPEDVLGGIDGGMKHDNGVPALSWLPATFGRRNPFHVRAGQLVVESTVLDAPIPKIINTKERRARLVRMGSYGVFHTNFPFGPEQIQERELLLSRLEQSEACSTQLVGLVVQHSDLGGQVANKETSLVALPMLKFEMNLDNNNLGTEIIGEDWEMLEKQYSFIRAVVIPTVGPTGRIIYGSDNHPYYREWINQGPIRRTLGSIHLCSVTSKPVEIVI